MPPSDQGEDSGMPADKGPIHRVEFSEKAGDEQDTSPPVDIVVPDDAPLIPDEPTKPPPSYAAPPGSPPTHDVINYHERFDDWPDQMMLNAASGSGTRDASAPYSAPSSSILRSAAGLVDHNHLFDTEATWYSVRPALTTLRPRRESTPGSSGSTPSSTAVALDHELRQLTQGDLEDAKPWAQALFCPARMEWMFLARKEDVVLGCEAGASTTLREPLYEVRELQDMETTSPIPTAIISPEQGRLRSNWAGPWKELRDVMSGQTFLATVIPSSIPIILLAKLRKERREHPPVGQSGDEAFVSTMRVLVRILLNAGKSDTRVLPLTSRTITNKLGYDDVMREILRCCGMIQTTTEATGQPALKASAEDPDLTLRNLIEVVVWFQHFKPRSDASLNTDDLGFTIHAERTDASALSLALLDPQTELCDLAQVGGANEAYDGIGASPREDESVLLRLYNINKSRMPVQHRLFFECLTHINKHRGEECDGLLLTIAQEKSNGMFTAQELSTAYTDFGFDAEDGARGVVEVDKIAAAYKHALEKSSNTEAARHSRDQLRVIAASLSDPHALMEAWRTPITMPLAEAYRVLEISEHEAPDDSVGAYYSAAQLDAMGDAVKEARLKEALGAIANHRDSKALWRVYAGEEGDVEEADAEFGKADLPAGLNNIGNTCYLNSVLQYFFALKPVRDGVVRAAKAKEQGARGEKKVGGRVVSAYEVERSSKFVACLAQLFDAMITSPAAAVTPERELAYLALVSARVEELEKEQSEVATAHDGLPSSKQARLEETPGMDLDKKAEAKEAEEQAGDDRRESGASTDGSADATMKDENAPPPLPPRRNGTDTPRHAAVERRMQLGAQQDVSECLDNVLFQVQVALGDDDEIARLFTGKTRQRVVRTQTAEEAAHVKEEIFTILPVEVPEEEGRDIYDGLDGYFDEEVLPASEAEGSRPGTPSSTVKRTVTLLEPPPILQIQLQRVLFDRTRGVFKSQAHLEAPEDLYLDRYLDAGDPRQAQGAQYRREMLACRERLEELGAGSVATTLRKTSKALDDLALGSQDDSPLSTLLRDAKLQGLSTFLGEEAERVSGEVEGLRTRLRTIKRDIESLWSGATHLHYRLVAVFQHRGQASHGHHWIEMRGGDDSRWFKYNDTVVSRTTARDVLKKDTATGATPYLLCYVREGAGDVFESLCRKIDAPIVERRPSPSTRREVPVPPSVRRGSATTLPINTTIPDSGDGWAMMPREEREEKKETAESNSEEGQSGQANNGAGTAAPDGHLADVEMID